MQSEMVMLAISGMRVPGDPTKSNQSRSILTCTTGRIVYRFDEIASRWASLWQSKKTQRGKSTWIKERTPQKSGYAI